MEIGRGGQDFFYTLYNSGAIRARLSVVIQPDKLSAVPRTHDHLHIYRVKTNPI
jgi:hypothetical protein